MVNIFFISYFSSILQKKLSCSLCKLYYSYTNTLNYILGTENGYLIM